jgi:O-acetyl-ADP-ribose deacetylase (regulator of RNase III)
MPLEIIRDDITHLHVDAIVNSANSQLKEDGGICRTIFRAASREKLQAACDKIGSCTVGMAVITEGYDLPAKYIIHTVSPIWRGGEMDEEKLLYSCYESCMSLAEVNSCKSIAFPVLASGAYGFPRDRAVLLATTAINTYCIHSDLLVYLVVYTDTAYATSVKLTPHVETNIDSSYVSKRLIHSARTYKEKEQEIQKRRYINECHPRETFSETLQRLIKESGRSNPDIYRAANITKQTFSHIINNREYSPNKTTVLAFGVALRLPEDGIRALLQKAGYSISPSSTLDDIVLGFVRRGNYDLDLINSELLDANESTLGQKLSD